MSDDTKAPSIAWVRQHVDQRVMGLCGIIGAESGTHEKEMRQYVDQQAAMLVTMLEAQGRKIAALEAKLAKTASAVKRK